MARPVFPAAEPRGFISGVMPTLLLPWFLAPLIWLPRVVGWSGDFAGRKPTPAAVKVSMPVPGSPETCRSSLARSL